MTFMRRLAPFAILAVTLVACGSEDETSPSGGAGADCVYGGQVYQHGDNFPAMDGCNTCFCDNGSVGCTEMACGTGGSTTGGSGGSTGTDCVYGGQVYQQGESFPAGDGCNSCFCDNGNVGCTQMACITGGTGGVTGGTGGITGGTGGGITGGTGGGITGGTGGLITGGTGGDTTGGTGGVITGGVGGDITGGTGGITGGTGGATGGTGGTDEVCQPGANYPAPNLAATPTTVYTGSGSGLFEGPVWVAQAGALFFSDMTFPDGPNGPPSQIHRLTPPNTVTAGFINPSGSNGLALASTGGTLVGCTHDTQSISLFDPIMAFRNPTPLVDNYLGSPFNSPNDLTIRSDGTIYFTDPDWQSAGRPGPGTTGVYRVPPGQGAILVDGSLNNPNGIALSPDETVLYVGDVSGRVSSYQVNPDGSTGTRNDFATVSEPDGMTVDCAGNLYVTSHGGGAIHVFAPDGTALGQIAVASSLTNVAFGGTDRMTLYATAGKTLYAIQMNLPGYPH